MLKKKYLTNNLKEFKIFSEFFLKKLKNKNKSIIVLLSGDLGSGKTTFTQNIGKILKIKENITSPTFVISKTYKIPKNNFINKKKLIHIDAYRLTEKNDLKNIGLNQQIKNPENLIFIEWPEIIKKNLPKNTINLKFKYINENKRKIIF